MTDDVIVFGIMHNISEQIVRLTLEEKGVPHRIVRGDIPAKDGPRRPAFEHDGFRLWEIAAITRYIDDAFDGPALMPQDAKMRARVNQIIPQSDFHASNMGWDEFRELVGVPQKGGVSDSAERFLFELGDLMGEDDYLVGSQITLADLHAAPVLASFRKAPGGARRLAHLPALVRWWEGMSMRPSVQSLTRSR
jgi:glutathione S-transferase